MFLEEYTPTFGTSCTLLIVVQLCSCQILLGFIQQTREKCKIMNVILYINFSPFSKFKVNKGKLSEMLTTCTKRPVSVKFELNMFRWWCKVPIYDSSGGSSGCSKDKHSHTDKKLLYHYCDILLIPRPPVNQCCHCQGFDPYLLTLTTVGLPLI